MQKSGTLVLKPSTGRLYRDTETFGKMDPYIIFQVGSTKQKTKTHQSGGKTPSWKDVLTFDIGAYKELQIRVMDEDTTSDDQIGETRINLDPVMKTGSFKDWVTIHHKGKEAGQIYLEILYVGVGGQQQPGMPQTTTTVTYQMPQQMAGMMPGMMPQQMPGMMPQQMPGMMPQMMSQMMHQMYPQMQAPQVVIPQNYPTGNQQQPVAYQQQYAQPGYPPQQQPGYPPQQQPGYPPQQAGYPPQQAGYPPQQPGYPPQQPGYTPQQYPGQYPGY